MCVYARARLCMCTLQFIRKNKFNGFGTIIIYVYPFVNFATTFIPFFHFLSFLFFYIATTFCLFAYIQSRQNRAESLTARFARADTDSGSQWSSGRSLSVRSRIIPGDVTVLRFQKSFLRTSQRELEEKRFTRSEISFFLSPPLLFSLLRDRCTARLNATCTA